MTHFLEEFYYGNINPQASSVKKDSEMHQLVKEIDETEWKLMKRLQKEEQELLLDLTIDYADLTADTGLDGFLTGFRLGARFTYDTFVSDEALFEDLVKKE